MGKLTSNEFEEIKELVDEAITAQNKEIANKFICKLEFIQQTLNIKPYAKIVFSELVSSVRAASGRVKEKERRLYTVNQCLYKLKFLLEEQTYR